MSAKGQFERTLIIADKGSYVSYLEGCTAPMRDANQLHAAVAGALFKPNRTRYPDIIGADNSLSDGLGRGCNGT
jgi:Fe-S cluster assembly protein SufB